MREWKWRQVIVWNSGCHYGMRLSLPLHQGVFCRNSGVPLSTLWHRVQRSFVWINELLVLSLTLKNVYTCRLARLITQWDLNESTVNDFFASSLTRSTLLFTILKINNHKPYPHWCTQRCPKGDRRLSPEGRPRHEVPSKKKDKGGNLYHLTSFAVNRITRWRKWMRPETQ